MALTSTEALIRLRGFLEPFTTVGELELGLIEGGWRIKRTQAHHVDVLRMFYSFRVVTTPVDFPAVYDRHWCYDGTDPAAFTAAVLAAAMWDGADATEPEGWNKNGQTREWRSPGTEGTWQGAVGAD